MNKKNKFYKQFSIINEIKIIIKIAKIVKIQDVLYKKSNNHLYLIFHLPKMIYVDEKEKNNPKKNKIKNKIKFFCQYSANN